MRIICLQLSGSIVKGLSYVFILLRGHKPIPDRILGSQPVTLVIKEVKEEGFNHYLWILSEGEDASPMIYGFVRI